MTIADRIKLRREELGMSQEELAKKIGVKDKSSITKIEKSGDKISLKNIEKLSVALNCSIQFLMGWDESNGFKDPKVEKFHSDYSKLTDSDKQIIDKMIESLLSKQV